MDDDVVRTNYTLASLFRVLEGSIPHRKETHTRLVCQHGRQRPEIVLVHIDVLWDGRPRAELEYGHLIDMYGLLQFTHVARHDLDHFPFCCLSAYHR